MTRHDLPSSTTSWMALREQFSVKLNLLSLNMLFTKRMHQVKFWQQTLWTSFMQTSMRNTITLKLKITTRFSLSGNVFRISTWITMSTNMLQDLQQQATWQKKLFTVLKKIRKLTSLTLRQVAQIILWKLSRKLVLIWPIPTTWMLPSRSLKTA